MKNSPASAPPDAVLLERGPLSLEVWPSLGGCIASFSLQRAGTRIELMRRATPAALPQNDGREMASFPLFPFSNRVKNGKFSFGGRDLQLTQNTPPDHPIHGHVWQMPHEVVGRSDSHVELSCTYPGGEWPWRYTARHRFTLSESSLTAQLTIENHASEPMPFGFGMHPYFDRTPRVRLTAVAPNRWVGNEHCIPEWSEPVPPAWDFSTPKELDQMPMDGCLGPFAGRALIEWPERGVGLELQADPVFGILIVYVPPALDFFCVEPVSHVNDAFNLESRGVAGNGMRVLAPGASLSGQIVYRPRSIT